MLNREDIARRIPHQGSMCLLDRVVSWSAERIHCQASSHRAMANPLRAHGRLGIATGIEYAAQAMAIHGALLAPDMDGGPAAVPRAGYLASVRGVQFHAERLDDLAEDLAVHADRVLGEGHSIVYGFRVEAGGRPLLSGRATVVLNADLANRFGPPA